MFTKMQCMYGGAFLHKIRWSGCATFQDVCEQYVKYIKRKYVICAIVFNGYHNCLSTKDHEHIPRSTKQSNTEVHCMKLMKHSIKQDVFLANGAYESRFMLSNNLCGASNKVVECKGDADMQIVKFVVETDISVNVNVAADDTDVVLSCCSTIGMTQWLILQSLLRDKNNFWHQIFNQQPFKLIKTISSHITCMVWVWYYICYPLEWQNYICQEDWYVFASSAQIEHSQRSKYRSTWSGCRWDGTVSSNVWWKWIIS